MRHTEKVHVHALCVAQQQLDRYPASILRQETQAGPWELLSFSLEAERRSQGAKATGRVAPDPQFLSVEASSRTSAA